jgi:hypothetical protein
MSERIELHVKKSLSTLRCEPVNSSSKVFVHRHLHHIQHHDEHSDNFTDSEDLNTPDIYETTTSTHFQRNGFKTGNISLSRMSSSDSLSDYQPFHSNSIQQQQNQQLIHSLPHNPHHQLNTSHGSHYQSILPDQFHRSSGLLVTPPPPPLLLRVSPHPTTKCRQLPCRTFISTGSCPYGDRCVFLHDSGIMSRPVFIKCKVLSFIYLFLSTHLLFPFVFFLSASLRRTCAWTLSSGPPCP